MAGASGYVLKQIRGTDLVDAVRTSPPASPCSTPKPPAACMRPHARPGHRRRPAGRAHRARTPILALIGEGLTNRQIGDRLFLAEKTVKNYVSALFAKLGMQRRAQAAAYAAHVFGEQNSPREHRGG